MKQPGTIRIKDNKVYFEPDGLEKPNKNDWYGFEGLTYNLRLKEYEASKRLIKVSNVREKYTDCKFENENKVKYFEDGQRCEAEVNGTATIIELTKYVI